MYTRRALQMMFTFLLIPLLCTVCACGQTVAVLSCCHRHGNECRWMSLALGKLSCF